MLAMLEKEILRGKTSGSSSGMDMMLEQITQTSKKMIVGRQEILSQADKARENPKV
jgi:hypothetical protein